MFSYQYPDGRVKAMPYLVALAAILAIPISIVLIGREFRAVNDKIFTFLSETQVVGGTPAKLQLEQMTLAHSAQANESEFRREALRKRFEQAQRQNPGATPEELLS